MIIPKAEAAAVAYLEEQVDETENIVAGQSSADKDFQQGIICAAGNAVEDPPYTGNYFLELQILVKTIVDPDAADEALDHNALVAEVEAALKADDLAALLTAIELEGALAGFHCFNAQEMPHDTLKIEDTLIEIFKFRLYCCPSDIAAS